MQSISAPSLLPSLEMMPPFKNLVWEACLFVWACWACSSTSVMGKAWDRQAACSTGASLGSNLQRDRAPSFMNPPFHPLLTGQWPLGLCSWSVYSQSQLHLGIVQRVLGTHVLSHLSCLQEWIFFVYKCIYLVTMLLCVYESDTMQKLWNVLLKGLTSL